MAATRLLTTVGLALLLAAPASAQPKPEAEPRRSVIYFIGDGMGPAQVTLGRLGAAARGERYHLDRFTSVGLAATQSADYPVTDSAAAGTALASGVKTNNQMIGQDPEGQPLETILEVAHAQGYATGLVSTTRITHATPAAFVAKVPQRDQEQEIARQIAARDFPEVLIGGGLRFFKEPELAALRANGFQVVTDRAALAEAEGPRVAALLAKSHLPFVVDEGPILEELTQKAVELLSATGKPFFLMVEGGKIDHAGHQHDAVGMIHDQLDFDRAVGWALSQAAEREDLLIVVTADHATGDLGISEVADVPGLLAGKASSDVVARKAGKADDPAAMSRFAAAIEAAYGFVPTEAELTTIYARPKDYYWAATALGHVVSARFGIYFYDLEVQQTLLHNTHGHDGVMVPVLAAGPGAERFQGLYENTEVPLRIADALGLPRPQGAPAAASGQRQGD